MAAIQSPTIQFAYKGTARLDVDVNMVLLLAGFIGADFTEELSKDEEATHLAKLFLAHENSLPKNAAQVFTVCVKLMTKLVVVSILGKALQGLTYTSQNLFV